MRLSIPSPSRGEVHLGPFPLRGYALCIILGVVVAVIIGEKRLQKRGYPAGKVADIAVWAVPFGLVGGRLYSVITDNELYFRKGERPITALYVWNGGLGIWGAVALGALGAYIGARRNGVEFRKLADAVAPAIPVAQAIGRWGNWFNQELYGRPTHLPWAVHIDLAHRLPKYATISTYQPTFLYESIWDLGTAGVVLWAERRFRLGRGRAFAVYVATYCVGRSWIEYLRVDPAHRFFGLRLNEWTCLILFLLAVLYLYTVRDPAPLPPTDDDSKRIPVLVGGPPQEELADPAPITTPTSAHVGGGADFRGPIADTPEPAPGSASGLSAPGAATVGGTSATAAVSLADRPEAIPPSTPLTPSSASIPPVPSAASIAPVPSAPGPVGAPRVDTRAEADSLLGLPGLLGWPQSGSGASAAEDGAASAASASLGWPTAVTPSTAAQALDLDARTEAATSTFDTHAVEQVGDSATDPSQAGDAASSEDPG